MENIITPTPAPIKAKSTSAKLKNVALAVVLLAGSAVSAFAMSNFHEAVASSPVIVQERVGNECVAHEWMVPADFNADLTAYRASTPDAKPTRTVPCRAEYVRYVP